MSDSQSWYARKMAQMREAVQPFGARQPMQPQQFPQQPFPNAPQQQYPSQYNQQYSGQPLTYQPEQPVQAPRVTMDNLWGAMHLWKGGPAAKTNPDPCPQCGSNQWFPHVQADGPRRGPAPAGHCYNCGYNGGLFTQGDQANWAAAANQ